MLLLSTKIIYQSPIAIKFDLIILLYCCYELSPSINLRIHMGCISAYDNKKDNYVSKITTVF